MFGFLDVSLCNSPDFCVRDNNNKLILQWEACLGGSWWRLQTIVQLWVHVAVLWHWVSDQWKCGSEGTTASDTEQWRLAGCVCVTEELRRQTQRREDKFHVLSLFTMCLRKLKYTKLFVISNSNNSTCTCKSLIILSTQQILGFVLWRWRISCKHNFITLKLNCGRFTIKSDTEQC